MRVDSNCYTPADSIDVSRMSHADPPPADPDAAAAPVAAVRAATDDGAILFDSTRLTQADATLFDPRRWQGAVDAVDTRGGRGAVWRVRGEFGEGVLRHYRRGGLVAKLVRDRYPWRGEDATRSFREFRLLAELAARGLPVPRPLAAGYRRAGLTYRADLLTQLVPESRTFAETFADATLWPSVGRTLARFHREGVWHADLNAHNVLIDAEAIVWIIDFDRGRLRVPESAWQETNLLRLRRSLFKLGAGMRGDWPARWAELLDAYVAGGGDTAAAEGASR